MPSRAATKVPSWPLRAGRWSLIAIGVAFLAFRLVFVFSEMPKSYTGDMLALGSLRHSAAALDAGLDPYAYHPELEPQPQRADALSTNAPAGLPAASVLHKLDVGLDAFRVLLAASLGAALFLLTRRYGGVSPIRVVVLLATGSVAISLWVGQLYPVFALLATAGWLLLDDRRPAPAGVVLGVLVAFKLQFLLVPALLLAAGHRRVAAFTLGTAALLSLLSLVLYGPELYVDYARALDAWTHPDALWPDQSLGLIDLSATLLDTEVPGYLAVAGMVMAGVSWCRLERPDPLRVMAVALAMSIVASPGSWHGYLLVFLPVLLSRPWGLAAWTGVACFIVVEPAGAGILLIFAGVFNAGGWVSRLRALSWLRPAQAERLAGAD